MKDMIDRVSRIARGAGRIQMERRDESRSVEYKGDNDIVTDVDRLCEEYIVGELRKDFPGGEILAEEGGGTGGGAMRRWVIDPLDGTVNYAHGFPFFAVAVGLEEAGEPVLGVIYDPNRDELFAAAKGAGATLNGRRICVTDEAELGRSLLATGFAYSARRESGFDNLDHFANFAKRARAVRRPGSACIDLAWLACGRIDGFWELYLKPWDMAAGVCIIREAEGRVSSFDGGEFDLYGTQILATNGRIHDEMMEVLKTRDP